MKDVSEKEILNNKIEVSSAKRSLVYFLIDGSEIVYVGKTTMGVSRVLSHCGTKEFDSYSTIECDLNELDEMESNYIYKFGPKYNTTLPRNDKYITRHQLKKQYRVEGNAWRKIMKLYKITPNALDCFERSEVEEVLRRAKDDNIIHYLNGRNNDWYLT